VNTEQMAKKACVHIFMHMSIIHLNIKWARVCVCGEREREGEREGEREFTHI